jgi:phosphomannomutase
MEFQLALTKAAIRFYNSAGRLSSLGRKFSVLTPLHDDRRYVCPGESGEISRSIHLARMAASYFRCRSCPHGPAENGTSAVGVSAPARLASNGLRRTEQGFRGVSVNQLGRYEAVRWASSLARLLWDNGASESTTTVRRSPVIVIGYDGRPAAPEVMTGFMLGFERTSCRVIDIGLMTEPCLRFAVRRFDADAGVIITGSGCDPAWIGFDLCRKHGLPPEPELLVHWETLRQEPDSRPSRLPGSVSATSVIEEYEASLSSGFHALRPLRVVCGAASPLTLSRLESVFARLPGRLKTAKLPTRRRNLSDPDDADVLALGKAVCEHAAHLGVVIDDDASACAFLDERGELVPLRNLHSRLIELSLAEQNGGKILLTEDVPNDLENAAVARGGQPLRVAHADRAARLLFERGLLALGDDHRLWIGGEAPICDAIATLALVMQLLSRSDAEFSQVLRGSELIA